MLPDLTTVRVDEGADAGARVAHRLERRRDVVHATSSSDAALVLAQLFDPGMPRVGVLDGVPEPCSC